MAETMQLRLDSSEFNAAIQQLKVAIDTFIGAKTYLVQENGKVLATTTMQALAKQNAGVANMLSHLVLLAADMGGELVFTEDEESVSIKSLGFCGVQEPYGFTVCNLPLDHDGQHSWL